MKGTTFSVTRAIDRMPPTITAKTTAASASPVTHAGTPKTALIWLAAWLAWNMLPPPIAPSTHKTANSAASGRPNGRPRSANPLRM